MSTTELTPEMIRQFIEDADDLLVSFEFYLYKDKGIDDHIIADKDVRKRIRNTLKILKHVYLKESLVK